MVIRERSGSVVECGLKTEGTWVRALPASLCCVLEHINPSLLLVQPRKTRPYKTERLLMGRKESKSNQVR